MRQLKNLKNFIGFNSNIIPGEIVREEIVRIAESSNMAMYRVEYFTKYFNTEELRNKLIEKNKKEEAERQIIMLLKNMEWINY